LTRRVWWLWRERCQCTHTSLSLHLLFIVICESRDAIWCCGLKSESLPLSEVKGETKNLELKVEANNVDTWRCFNSKLSKLESSIQSEPKAHSFNKDVSTPIKYSTNYFGFFLPSLHQFEARIFIWLWPSRHHVPSFKLLPRVINCYQRACRAFFYFSA